MCIVSNGPWTNQELITCDYIYLIFAYHPKEAAPFHEETTDITEVCYPPPLGSFSVISQAQDLCQSVQS